MIEVSIMNQANDSEAEQWIPKHVVMNLLKCHVTRRREIEQKELRTQQQADDNKKAKCTAEESLGYAEAKVASLMRLLSESQNENAQLKQSMLMLRERLEEIDVQADVKISGYQAAVRIMHEAALHSEMSFKQARKDAKSFQIRVEELETHMREKDQRMISDGPFGEPASLEDDLLKELSSLHIDT